jgi:hypothetical protein
VLQCATAAHSEMPAWRISAFRPRSQPVDDPALAPPAAPRAKPGSDTIARHRKRQEDRLAPVLCDTVPRAPTRSTESSTSSSGDNCCSLRIIGDRFAGRSSLLAKRETRILTQ